MVAKWVVIKLSNGQERAISTRLSSVVKDPDTNEVLAEPTGGVARIHAEIVREIE